MGAFMDTVCARYASVFGRRPVEVPPGRLAETLLDAGGAPLGRDAGGASGGGAPVLGSGTLAA
jgi:hypothetical protein